MYEKLENVECRELQLNYKSYVLSNAELNKLNIHATYENDARDELNKFAHYK